MTTTELNLELRNIKYMASLSEETNCYSATVYLDGKPVCEVSNHGHGGCDMQRWKDAAAEAKITAYFKALPARDTGLTDPHDHSKPFMMQPDLEGWCGDRLTRWLVARDVKRDMSKATVVMTANNEQYKWKIPAARLGEKVRFQGQAEPVVAKDYILTKAGPGAVILNLLSPAELEATIDRMVSKAA